MRVLLVAQEYPPDTGHGGLATQTELKARGLARLGHTVTVLSHSLDHERHDLVLDDGVRVVRVPGPDHRLTIGTDAARWLAWSEEVATAIERMQAEDGIDLLDAAEWGAEVFFHLLNRTAAVPKVVIHLHGSMTLLARGLGWPEPDSELYQVGTMMEGTCIRVADAVYASSALSARACASDYGRRPARVLHSGVDLERLTPTADGGGDPVIAFVGRLGPSKGADTLVAAACLMAGQVPGLRVDLWGPSVDGAGERLQAQATEAGWPDLVARRGPVARPDLARALAPARVFAAPSPFEAGPGFVVLEAMACGLPVVAAGGSGLEESVIQDETGLLVPAGDAEALAAALAALVTDPARSARMGARARTTVEDQADTRACVAAIAGFYEEVLDQ